MVPDVEPEGAFDCGGASVGADAATKEDSGAEVRCPGGGPGGSAGGALEGGPPEGGRDSGTDAGLFCGAAGAGVSPLGSAAGGVAGLSDCRDKYACS